MGLAITGRLVEMLDGSVDVESREGEGSTFRGSIPVRVPDGAAWVDPQIAAAAREPAATADAAPLDCRVLMVDDRTEIRFLGRRILESAGAAVEEAEDGVVAVERVRESLASGDPPDLVLLDMQMPRMDGYEAAERIRTLGYAGPMVALTADAMHGDRGRCLAAGCDEYLSKPIDAARLRGVVRSLTASRR